MEYRRLNLGSTIHTRMFKAKCIAKIASNGTVRGEQVIIAKCPQSRPSGRERICRGWGVMDKCTVRACISTDTLWF